MPRFNSIKFYQNRPKIKLVFVKNRQNFRALGIPLPDLRTSPPPLQISGYVPKPNHVFAQLIFMPPEFSLMPNFKSVYFYQNKAEIKLFLQKNKFFERWGLRTQTPTGTQGIGRSFQTPEITPFQSRFLVTRQTLNV